MKKIYKDYLFEKNYLVSEESTNTDKNQFETLFALANLFNIRIVRGEKLVCSDMIKYVEERLGKNVPEPFYRGFPQSVRELSADKLLFDQLVNYFITYGLGDFSGGRHSIFEENFERTAFKEDAAIKEFSVICTEEAVSILNEMAAHLLAGTRPLSDEQFELVKSFIADYNINISYIGSKNTCIKLLRETRDMRYADFISLSDVIKLVDELNYCEYKNENIYKLNFKNRDRKFITSVIDRQFEAGRLDIRTCFEKKKTWNGLLHHIHYKAKNSDGQYFLEAMRGRENESVFSEFERAMASKDIKAAVDSLKDGKGSTAVLRKLNYIISRCESPDDLKYVIECIDSKNVIVLIQLLLEYSHYSKGNTLRTFKFSRHNLLKVYKETVPDAERRKSYITEGQANMLAKKISEILKNVLKGRLGKVYIDEAMAGYALPLSENTSQGGYGVLTRGSRIHLKDVKKIRAFTYWEKVRDIDLSVFGIRPDGEQKEFSWRTMSGNQSSGITYSGDVTDGYKGGSEFFDIDTEALRKEYPSIRYLVFCNNVFSRVPFSACVCRAGYMIRDTEDSGAVFEPKTIESSFAIDCDSMFAYLFGFDLFTNDIIWLNMSRNSSENVAGNTSMDFLTSYFHVTDVINVASFFEMMAEEVVDDISAADVVVTNKNIDASKLAEGAEVVREYDYEKMIALMNR